MPLTRLVQFTGTMQHLKRAHSWCTPLPEGAMPAVAFAAICIHCAPCAGLLLSPPWHAPLALCLEAPPMTSSTRAPSLTSPQGTLELEKVLAAEAGWVFIKPFPFPLSTQPECSLPVRELSPISDTLPKPAHNYIPSTIPHLPDRRTKGTEECRREEPGVGGATGWVPVS